MKVQIPSMVVSLMSVGNNAVDYRDGQFDFVDSGVPLIFDEDEVEVPSIFQGSHGPRFSPKPVYHRKPIGISKQGIYPVVTPQGPYLASLRTVDTSVSWECFLGMTVTVQWTYALRSGLFSRITYTIRCTFGYVDVRGSYRSCQLTFSPRVDSGGWTKGSIGYFPNRNPFPSGFASAMRDIAYTAAIVAGAAGFIGQPGDWESRTLAGKKIKSIDYSALNYIWQEYRTKFRSTAGNSVTFLTDVSFPTEPPEDLLQEQLRSEGEIVISSSNYHHNLLMQRSFLSACQSVPRLGDNNISNIAEFVSFLYNLIVRRKVDIPQSLSDAWLSYRYQYNTTKGDVETAIDFMRRHAQRYLQSTGLKVYGSHIIVYQGVRIQCRCCLVLKERELSYVNKIWSALDRYGLKPDFYIVWDMIPYSFIVDWFVPVGNILETWDASERYSEEHYEFSDIIYSISYTSEASSGLNWKTYRRWIEKAPPKLDGYYQLEDSGSSKVWGFRALDATSLTIGRK